MLSLAEATEATASGKSSIGSSRVEFMLFPPCSEAISFLPVVLLASRLLIISFRSLAFFAKESFWAGKFLATRLVNFAVAVVQGEELAELRHMLM